MAADIFINRTGIQTGAATDAIKTFLLFYIRKNVCPAIVEQDHIHFFRTISLAFLPWAGYKRIINSYRCQCHRCQQWPE